MVYFGQQTLAAQYFRPNYLHGAGGALSQGGKSGYWRLFFMQMQEEALKKYRPTADVEASTLPTIEESKKVKPKKKLEPLVELEAYEVPNFKRKAIYTQETKIEAQLPTLLSKSSPDIDALYKGVAKHITARRKKEEQQVEAANDADMRIRLLLLAA